MKLQLKEDPKEWRKAVWLGALGLALFSSLLCWRRVLPVSAWTIGLAFLALAALAAAARPRWFRGYYRFAGKVGFRLAQWFGFVVLVLLFLLVLTPMGWVLRWCGKDLLRLRHSRTETTHWTPSRPSGPLDRSF